MEGYKDPFCRRTYPWGKEDTELLSWFEFLGKTRASLECLKDGGFEPVYAKNSTLVYIRRGEKDAILVAVNAAWNSVAVDLPEEFVNAECLLGDYNGGEHLTLAPTSAAVLKISIEK